MGDSVRGLSATTNQERLLEESVTRYNDVVGDLLEKHAPLKTKWLTIHPAAPCVTDKGWCGDGGCPS